MKIEANRIVRFHYRLSDASGVQIESSEGRDPLAFMVGRNAIIPGLEAALIGREAGDRVEVTVTPDQAYGERREGLVQRVAKKYFREKKLEPGQAVLLQTGQGPRMVVVRKVGMSVVDVDLNHPMAGKTLSFSIDIVDVREPDADELSHGHAHGAGGHAHQ